MVEVDGVKVVGKLAMAAGLIVAGYFLNDAVRFLRRLEPSYHRVCTLDAGIYGAGIDIYTPGFNEGSKVLLYRVRTGGRRIESPMHTMCVVDVDREFGQEDFAVLQAKGGKLVAVVLRRNPKRVLAMYDFSTGQSWPRSPYAAEESWVRSQGEQLLAILKKETGNDSLSLGGPALEGPYVDGPSEPVPRRPLGSAVHQDDYDDRQDEEGQQDVSDRQHPPSGGQAGEALGQRDR